MSQHLTDREVMQQALEALEMQYIPNFTMDDSPINNAITALRERLAQPDHSVDANKKDEPVAWRYRGNLHEFDPSDWADGPVTPLYTRPQPAAAERNKIAAWMMSKGYATGHGDTVEGLLNELEWQVRESEREACAKVCEEQYEYYGHDHVFAAAVRARGQS